MRGPLFGRGVFGVACMIVYNGFCFVYIMVFLLGVFWVVLGEFYFVFAYQNFCSGLADCFVRPPSYFVCLILVLFCCVVYSVLCMCCVRFVYSLSRTWLAPVQRCMYDTCYMSVLSHKTMQQCEKLHNKTLQTTTR